MTNWSEELTHDGSAECPVPEGVVSRRTYKAASFDYPTPEWSQVSIYRYDTDQMREHLMENWTACGGLTDTELHFFEKQERVLRLKDSGWQSEVYVYGINEVYRPIPEPKTFERFVNVGSNAAITHHTKGQAELSRETLHNFTYRDTYNAETGERVSSECIWSRDDD